MEETIVVRITNKKAVKLLQDLEELELIKIEKNGANSGFPVKLSDKYRGVFSREDADSFNEHTKISRNQWDNI